MGKRYLLDTNTVIDFMGGKFPPKPKASLSKIIDEEINLSVINKFELLSFSKDEQDLNDFVEYSDIYMIDDNIVNKTIEIRQKYKTKLPDAVIAATSLQHSFTLITNNVKDFKNIKGLDFVNPYEDL